MWKAVEIQKKKQHFEFPHLNHSIKYLDWSMFIAAFLKTNKKNKINGLLQILDTTLVIFFDQSQTVVHIKCSLWRLLNYSPYIVGKQNQQNEPNYWSSKGVKEYNLVQRNPAKIVKLKGPTASKQQTRREAGEQLWSTTRYPTTTCADRRKLVLM